MNAPTLVILSAALLTISACAPKVRYNDVPVCDFDEYEEANARRQGEVLVNRVEGSITDIPLNSVVYADPRLKRKVIVQSVKAKRTEAATVEVTARYRNCTEETLKVASRTAFLGDDQSSVEPQSAWRTVFIQPYTTGVYQEKSIGQGSVASFLIEIRQDDF